MVGIKKLKETRKKLVTNMTSAEKLAEDFLIKAGIKYRKQVIFGFYILDFFVPCKMLVIEIDGHSHDFRKKHDNWRDEFCRKFGLKVLRIKNENISSLIKRYNQFANVKNYTAKWTKARNNARLERVIAEYKSKK